MHQKYDHPDLDVQRKLRLPDDSESSMLANGEGLEWTNTISAAVIPSALMSAMGATRTTLTHDMAGSDAVDVPDDEDQRHELRRTGTGWHLYSERVLRRAEG